MSLPVLQTCDYLLFWFGEPCRVLLQSLLYCTHSQVDSRHRMLSRDLRPFDGIRSASTVAVPVLEGRGVWRPVVLRSFRVCHTA